MTRRSLLLLLSAFAITPKIFGAKTPAKKDSSNVKAAAKMPALIDQKKCVHCGTCFSKCPVKAISKEMVDKVAVYTVDPKKCISCGTCIKNCPVKAISWATGSEAPADSQKVAPKKKTETKKN